MKERTVRKRRRASGSLASGINIAYLIAFAVFLFLLSGSVFLILRFIINSGADTDLNDIYSAIKNNNVNILDTSALRNVIADKPVIITIRNSDNTLVSTERGLGVTGEPPVIKEEGKISSFDNIQYHFRTLMKKINYNDKTYFLQISRDMGRESRFYAIISNILLYAIVVALAVSAFIGYKVAEYMLKPISTITHTINEISVNNLNTRIDTAKTKSELRELANSINTTLDKIKAAYDNQSRFVSDASHELRTPLSVIQGYADLISRWGKEDPAVLDESINAIKTQTVAMNELVNKLLFLTRAESKGLTITPVHFNFYELTEEISADIKFIFPKLRIVNSIRSTLLLYADRALIRQLFVILLDNAAKYTPSGGSVTISDEIKENGIKISVADTGIGIPKDSLEKIFNRFYRVDRSRAKGTGGSGLGLAIAKYIVKVHGGEIIAESELGKGTKISVFFPQLS